MPPSTAEPSAASSLRRLDDRVDEIEESLAEVRERLGFVEPAASVEQLPKMEQRQIADARDDAEAEYLRELFLTRQAERNAAAAGSAAE